MPSSENSGFMGHSPLTRSSPLSRLESAAVVGVALVGASSLGDPGGPDLGDASFPFWAMHSENNAMYAVVRCWNGLQGNFASSAVGQAKRIINAMHTAANSGDDGNKNAKRFCDIWEKVYLGATGRAYPYDS